MAPLPDSGRSSRRAEAVSCAGERKLHFDEGALRWSTVAEASRGDTSVVQVDRERIARRVVYGAVHWEGVSAIVSTF